MRVLLNVSMLLTQRLDVNEFKHFKQNILWLGVEGRKHISAGLKNVSGSTSQTETSY